MASFKIHQDQENLIPDLRQKASTNAMAAQNKRTVLGVIDQNKVNKVFGKGKQSSNVTVTQNGCDENKRKNNENKKNLVVPVAQFEAFKVYEDDEYRQRIDEKLKQISKTSVYKGTSEDKFITKAELAESEKQKIIEKVKDFADLPPIHDVLPHKPILPETPMSIDRSFDENDEELAEEIILQNSCIYSRDLFFQMDEYREDIYAYLREHELRHRPKPGYILKQPDVTESMRTILVDWLVEVAEEYGMQTETLYLAVNFIDRFLSYMSVVRAKLQLVGTAAMFIAAKYEEIYPPPVKEFVYITDDTYTKNQVLRMEHLILRVLGFDLSIPTPLTFINAMCISAKLSQKILHLAMYLSELSLLEVEQYLQFLPSVIAASAIALARHTLNEKEVWSEVLQKTTGYELKQLEKCVNFLNDMFVNAPNNPQHAIQDKYRSIKLMQVSKIVARNERIKFD